VPSSSFSARIVRWQRRFGRHDLPWQGTRDPYRIWLSEIMLQQTQVATVLPYFERFLARFPRVEDLAAANEDQVLALWSGLGYYARARNLHRAARAVVQDGRGFPSTFEALLELPGVGRSTAAAIAAFASGERQAILDGNVKRVLARHAGIAGDPSQAAVLARLWEAAESRLPARGIEPYTQGLMDIGATLCAARQPRCGECPVAHDCVARETGRIDQLPGRKRRAPARRKHIAMLVIVSRGEVLLEKRASTGIWGGLWSLPEIDASERPKNAEPLPPFTHAFTHFTLEVTPWLVRTPTRGDRPGTMWLPLTELSGAALPSPVRKLLTAV
jgi:A/G-specific adenine glycosylase